MRENMEYDEHELTTDELEEIKLSLIIRQKNIEFNAKMGFNYHIAEEYDFITEILNKIEKMIKIQNDIICGRFNTSNSAETYTEYNKYEEEILSDGDVPF